MRIMAGLDTTHAGDAKPFPGTKIGYFAQEPDLGSAKTVWDAVSEGVAETQALLTRFEEVSAKLGEPMDDDAMTALLEEQAKLQDRDRRDGRVEPRSPRRARDARAASPAEGRRHQGALRRREKARRALPAAPLAARHAAPRRAHQPPRRRVGALARAVPPRVPGHRGRGHPRSLLPRQRRRLDPRARPRPRLSVRGQLLRVARAEVRAPRPRGEAGVGAAPQAAPGARVGALVAARAPGEEQGAPRRVRRPARELAEGRSRSGRHHDPSGPAPRRRRHRGERPREEVRRQGAHRRPLLHLAAQRHRRGHRAERRRQDHALPHARRSREARRRDASSSARR